MTDPEQINTDQRAFWNGAGGHTWVARQAHTDLALRAVSEALLAYAAPQAGERVLDIGCGCERPRWTSHGRLARPGR